MRQKMNGIDNVSRLMNIFAKESCREMRTSVI